MKIDITIDLDNFMDNWSDKDLNGLVQEEIKGEVMRAVKKSPEYKKTVKERTEKALARFIEEGP